MSLATRLGAVSFVALIGCGTTNNPSDGTEGPVVATTVELPQRDVTVAPATTFYTTDKLGYRGFMDAFQAKDAVYLDASGGLPAAATSAKFVPGHDFYYQVFDSNGANMSSDDLECRRVHISATSTIVAVYNATNALGVPCTHPTSTDVNPDGGGGLLVNLMPFADSAVVPHSFQSAPAMHYTVKLAAAEGFTGDFSHELGFEFMVAMPQPLPPVSCGNGVVDDGEQCDDGNTVSGDGCSSVCTCEHK